MATTTFAGPVLSKNGFGYVSGATSAAGVTEADKVLSADSNLEVDGLGVLRVVDKILTTAQVKALFATPIEVVPAPGAGKTLIFEGAYFFMDFATTAYVDDAGDDFVFKYTDASGLTVSQAIDGDILDNGADLLVWVRPVAVQDPITTQLPTVNAAIVAHILTSELITGDSPFKLRVYYRIVRTAALEAIA